MEAPGPGKEHGELLKVLDALGAKKSVRKVALDVLAPDIADEYVRVVERLEERHDDVEIQPIIALVIQNATLVSATRLPSPVCDDPDDDKFLACARGSGTHIVVSGDKKLRATSGYEGIQVLTPREFIDRFLSDSGAS